MDRFLLHKTFYLPACVALFLGIPGSLTLFNFPAYTDAFALEHWETALIVIVAFAGYTWLLISPVPIQGKLAIGSFLFIFTLYLNCYRIREGVPDLVSMWHLEGIFELTILRNWLWFFLLFCALCLLDRVKRSAVALSSVGVFCVLFLSQGLHTLKNYRHLDVVIAQDVRDRLKTGDYSTPLDLENECGKISEDSEKLRCTELVRANFQLGDCVMEDVEFGGALTCYQKVLQAQDKGTVPSLLPYEAGILR